MRMIHFLLRNLAVASTLAGMLILFTLPCPAQWKLSTGGGDAITALASNGSEVVEAAADSIYLSTDNGETYLLRSANLPIVVTDITVAQSKIFIGNNGSNSIGFDILYSSDSGIFWLDDTAGYGDPLYYSTYSLASNGLSVFAGSDVGVYTQPYPGATWKPDTEGTSASFASGPSSPWSVDDIISDGTSNLYMSADYSGFLGQIFYSSNAGKSWNEIGHSSPLLDSSKALFLQKTPSKLYVVTQFTDSIISGINLFSTANNGQTWTEQNSSYLLWGHVHGFVSSGETLFVACDSGVMVSIDHGVTWKAHNENLPPPTINHFIGSTNFLTSIVISGPNLVLGTYENGVWYRPLSDFGVSSVAPNAEANTLSRSLSISENPTQSSTVEISYSITENGISKITLSDALGRKIRTLHNGWSTAGMNTVSLDLQSLPPGIYFVRLEANGSSEMQKLVITK